MNKWLLPVTDLTQQQLSIVKMPIHNHRIVSGVAGSGKTQILIHRAKYLTDNYNIAPNRYRIFVFTNVVKDYIKSGLRFIGLNDSSTSTFDHWCRLFYEKHISNRLPVGLYGAPDFRVIRDSVLDFLINNRAYHKQLDFVLVDEGQDLDEKAYDILTLISKHITVFIDPMQKIFDNGVSGAVLLKKLGVDQLDLVLLKSYRNSPFVSRLASYFINNKRARDDYLKHISSPFKTAQLPALYKAKSKRDEIDKMAEIIKERILLNERIGIIVPSKRDVKTLCNDLRVLGIKTEEALSSHISQCDFDNDLPKIMTFFSAKGLTFDTIIVPFLDNSYFEWVGDEKAIRLMFVAIARAKKWVFLSYNKKKETGNAAVKILLNAVKNGNLALIDEHSITKSNNNMGDDEGDDFDVL